MCVNAWEFNELSELKKKKVMQLNADTQNIQHVRTLFVYLILAKVTDADSGNNKNHLKAQCVRFSDI